METLMKEKMERAQEVKEVNDKAKSKQIANMILRVPVIRKIETTAAKQEIIDKAVAEARQYIADIPNHMESLVSRIRKIRAASPEEQAIRSGELKALEDEVLAHLNSGEELLANAARRAHDLAVDSTLSFLANISVAEMLTRKPGRVFMNISDTRDGKRFLPGGRLLVESDGKVVKVVEAYGNFQRIITEIAEAKTFVLVETLSRERFGDSGRIPEEKFRLCRILHAVLRRGVAEAQKEEELKPQLQK